MAPRTFEREPHPIKEDARRSFLAEAEASWADYKATGLHLTGEETRAWLRRWGERDGAEAPDCHE